MAPPPSLSAAKAIQLRIGAKPPLALFPHRAVRARRCSVGIPCRAALRKPGYRTGSEELCLCLRRCGPPPFRPRDPGGAPGGLRAAESVLGVSYHAVGALQGGLRARREAAWVPCASSLHDGGASGFASFIVLRCKSFCFPGRRVLAPATHPASLHPYFAMVFALLAQPPGLGVVKAIRVRIGAKPPRAFMPRDRRALGTRNR